MKKIKTLFLLITLLASFSFGAAWTGANSEPESTQTIDGKKFYVITTPEELAWVAKQVNAGYNKMNAVLANDIVFGEDTASVNTEYAWTPIGKDGAHAFEGILDGAGYSIYGVWTDSTLKYAGLVGILDSAGVVRNVNMKRNSINASDVAGGIVGRNDGTVSGCTNEGTVRVPGGDFSYAGGIVGRNDGTVSGCTNEGTVRVPGGDFPYAGGVVGYNEGGTVSDCANEGSVSGFSYAGGIVGYNEGGTVSDCANEGSVSSDRGWAGGIVGGNSGTVSGCTNEGSVSSDRGWAGGIVGGNSGTVSGCTNSGIVSGNSDAGGGIVGANYGTVSGCTNEGSVSGFSSAGGVVGYNEGGTVSDCANEGSVSGESSAGGIVGNNGGSKARVKNSYSRTDTLAFMGDAEAYRGGVAGVNTDKALIINCYYDSEKLPDVSAIGSDSATATDVSGMTTAEMQSDQFVLILNTTNGSEENSGLWSRDGGYPILVSVAKPGGSTALHVTAQPRFNLQVQNRTIWVQNARVGESFAVFDVQGHVLRRGVVNSAELFLSVQNAGAYIVRMGTETMRVRVK